MTEEKKHAGGRPLKFETPQILQEKIDEFFELCKTNGDIPLVEGLALHLDTNCQTILNYADREDYAPIVSRAKLRIAQNFMQRSVKGDINPTLTIFIAHNHYDYKQKSEVVSDINNKGTVTLLTPDLPATIEFLGKFAKGAPETPPAGTVQE